GVGCGVMVGVKEGKVLAVAGDELSPVNRGLLCIKGYSLPGVLYGEDRLTHPLIRTNGTLKQASWDEALGLIAARFQETLAAHGPTAVAMYGSGQWTISDGYVASKWFRAGMGSNNVEANARLCMASAVTGFITSFGLDEPMGNYDDLEAADVLVLWGNNMAEMHPVLFSRILESRRQRPEVRIIDIGTRRTPTTEWADQFIPMQPQGDLALANAIAHLIIESERVNQDFVRAHTVFRRGKENIGYGLEDNFKFKDQPTEMDFDQFRAYLADYTPEKAAGPSGVPAETIRQLAEVYADPKVKVVSLWCMGMNQHVRGTWINNLVNNLHLLTGKIGRPGNNPFSLTGQPSACGTVREVGTLAHRLPADMVVTNPEHRKLAAEIWDVPVEQIPPTPGYNTVEMFRALDRGDIRALWIQCTNPMVTMPNLHRYRNATEKQGRFIVVSEIYPTPTTEIADVILPSALWVERTGMFGNSERRTQHWFKVVDPPGEATPDVWQQMEVARRMGYGKLFDYGQDYEREIFEEYRRFTLGHGHDLAGYDDYVEHRGLRWPVVDGKETPYRYVEGFDPYVPAGAGYHFYGNEKKTGGKAVIWARPYEPPAEVPDDDYPFWLTTGRVLEHWHTGSMTRRVPQLHAAVPAAYVELHPDDARRLAVQAGERVRLVTRRGQLELNVVTEGRGQPLPGSVFVPFFDEGKLINHLTLDAYCPISKQPDYKKCAVRVEKIAATEG
ncbi:MAG: molybdopterin-dependent oxidoreductase, partial [Acidobacteria bacterium]|nr:molybdopterin-dependent oxidoreductase [Acidobacteriota bacterium]